MELVAWSWRECLGELYNLEDEDEDTVSVEKWWIQTSRKREKEKDTIDVN